MFDVHSIVASGGILAIALIIFAETGLLLGFFLPGDTLLVAAGIFASQHKSQLPLVALLIIVAIAAIAGYEVGYIIGKRAGPRFFKRKDGLLFREEYVLRAEKLAEKHGGKSILIARFIAIVRTIVPLVAGMGKMPRKKFVIYNFIGGAAWTSSVILAAYWIGSRVPNIDRVVLPLILLAMIGTVGIMMWQFGSSAQKRRELKIALREEWGYLFNKNKS
jgi:membrane-associated protein